MHTFSTPRIPETFWRRDNRLFFSLPLFHVLLLEQVTGAPSHRNRNGGDVRRIGRYSALILPPPLRSSINYSSPVSDFPTISTPSPSSALILRDPVTGKEGDGGGCSQHAWRSRPKVGERDIASLIPISALAPVLLRLLPFLSRRAGGGGRLVVCVYGGGGIW